MFGRNREKSETESTTDTTKSRTATEWLFGMGRISPEERAKRATALEGAFGAAGQPELVALTARVKSALDQSDQRRAEREAERLRRRAKARNIKVPNWDDRTGWQPISADIEVRRD